MTEKGTFDLKLAQTCAKAFAVSCGIGCVVSDASGNVKYEYGYGCSSCQLCQAAGRGDQECIQAHNYGMEESARFGGKYIYFWLFVCDSGRKIAATPVFMPIAAVSIFDWEVEPSNLSKPGTPCPAYSGYCGNHRLFAR